MFDVLLNLYLNFFYSYGNVMKIKSVKKVKTYEVQICYQMFFFVPRDA